jgi:phosphinothricin acetyltransferase
MLARAARGFHQSAEDGTMPANRANRGIRFRGGAFVIQPSQALTGPSQDWDMIIRDAIEADVPEIQSIYAHHVLTGTGTFEEEPPSVEDMLARYRIVVDHGWRWLVAADDTGVLGYGYYTQFRDRSAYRYCVEDSVYVRENVRGQGVGKALVQKLVEICTAAGMRQMIAVIGDSENVGSIGVHASVGFRNVGTLHASGIKFGRWLDAVYMQRALGRGDLDIPA